MMIMKCSLKFPQSRFFLELCWGTSIDGRTFELCFGRIRSVTKKTHTHIHKQTDTVKINSSKGSLPNIWDKDYTGLGTV